MQAEKKHIVSALGGPTVLGIKDSPDFDMLIRKGIPVKSGMYVKDELRLSNRELAETIGISERTLARKDEGHRLTPSESDRLFRAASVYAFAIEVLGDKEGAASWLHRPQIGLGGKVPIVLLQTEAGSHEVEDLLGRIAHGILS